MKSQSVSQISRKAAQRVGDTLKAKQADIASGRLYHAGEKSGVRRRYSILILAAGIFLIIFGIILGGAVFNIIAVIGFLFLVYFTLYLYWFSRSILQGLPGGVFYDDNLRQGRKSYLHDNQLGLHGSPDYIMEHNGKYYVVEYKTRSYGLPQKPNYKHLAQLVSYHMMLEKQYPQKMWDFGYMIYQSRFSNRIRRFKYKIDDFMKNEVLRNLA